MTNDVSFLGRKRVSFQIVDLRALTKANGALADQSAFWAGVARVQLRNLPLDDAQHAVSTSSTYALRALEEKKPQAKPAAENFNFDA